tara:strand:+ start:209 stop:430 length:222 start_codon:yes stop_codon:yes gene_type:complete
MVESSFYFGAIYLNYRITVPFSVITFLIASVLSKAKLLQYFAAIIITLLLLAIINLRLSRIVWTAMFVEFERE